jgi:hypothetical protein
MVTIPTDMLVTSFKAMWPDGTASDLQRIMTIKGLKKSEQQQVREDGWGRVEREERAAAGARGWVGGVEREERAAAGARGWVGEGREGRASSSSR